MDLFARISLKCKIMATFVKARETKSEAISQKCKSFYLRIGIRQCRNLARPVKAFTLESGCAEVCKT